MNWIAAQVGGLVATGLVTALVRWILKKARKRPPRIVVHVVAYPLAATLYMLGSADLDPVNVGNFLYGLSVYFFPQIFWFVLEWKRKGSVTATQSPIVKPDGLDSIATLTERTD